MLDVLIHLIVHIVYFYRSQQSCEGYVFTAVCLSTGGGSASVHAWIPLTPPPLGPGTIPPGTRHALGADPPPHLGSRPRWDLLGVYPPGPGTLLRADTPPPGSGTPLEADLPGPGTPLGADPPPADGYCCGEYASYWNAFLL